MTTGRLTAAEHELAFLHTSAIHISRFENLVQAMAPGLKVHHQVNEALLLDAQAVGINDANIRLAIQTAMQEAAASGAALVVCTCSTIGEVAEQMNGKTGFATARIDRAMADQAVRGGTNILLVAALESTLQPSTVLLEESARRLNKQLNIRTLTVKDAWTHFIAGDNAAYLQAIAEAIELAVQGG